MKMFDGRKIRDEVLAELKAKIEGMEKRPMLAVFLIGEDSVSAKYVDLKKRLAEKIGIEVQLFKYGENVTQDEVLRQIDELNDDDAVDGIMVQIPVPEGLDRSKIIELISPNKDVDGLRYCQGLESDFIPPVVCAIARALELSQVDLEEARVTLVGHGFLVGRPLERYLGERTKKLVIADATTPDISSVIKYADVIVSATGSTGLIKSEMVKEGAVLIDAGTSEVGGKLVGDVDPKAYAKSSFYTPVPGGIGPVTVAYLLKNVVDSLS